MKQFLLITGISGSGKSTYCQYLQKEYAFYCIMVDDQPSFIQEATLSNAGLVDRYLEKHDCMVVEWGFAPHLLHFVLGLKDQGAKLLWFNCPENLAFSNYSAKWNNDPSRLGLWHAQFNNIKQANLPTFDFQVVETMRDGNFRPYEELDREVLEL